jgi:hypothetical protein
MNATEQAYIHTGHLAGNESANLLLNAIEAALAESQAVTVDWHGAIVASSTYAYFYQLAQQRLSVEQRQRVSFVNIGLAARDSMHSAIQFVESAAGSGTSD